MVNCIEIYLCVAKALKSLPFSFTQLETPYGIQVHSIKDVPADAFIKAFAEHLKSLGKFRLPEVWTECWKYPTFEWLFLTLEVDFNETFTVSARLFIVCLFLRFLLFP